MWFWKRSKKKEEEVGGARRRRTLHPADVKLLAVEARESGLGSREVAEMLGTAPTTVENWFRAYREGGAAQLVRSAGKPGRRRICRALEERIAEKRREDPEAGTRRIRDELARDEGLSVSAETVRRVVNDAGLGNPAPRSHKREEQVRRFERAVPNALWQIDIFTFELKRMYPAYLVGIIDDHSRYIVGHGLFRQQKAEAVMEVVKGAIGQWGAPRELLSDNGRQFVAWHGKTRFQKVLTRQGIQHVRSAPHHPMTLGKIERFWRTLWEEFLEEAVFASFADARQRLDHWVAYYNHQRPHQGIDGACPADRFYGVAGDVAAAVKQGCAENSLQLALGQETRPPLYLLGKLGGTDVRVTRKGDDIEVRLGDEVRELIRLGSPYTVAEAVEAAREEEADEREVVGDERRGAIPGGGAGAEWNGIDERALRELCRDAADAGTGDGEGGRGGAGGAGAREARAQGEERGGGADYRALEEAILLGEGGGELEDEVRGDEALR
jgi:transposase InsO family protein